MTAHWDAHFTGDAPQLSCESEHQVKYSPEQYLSGACTYINRGRQSLQRHTSYCGLHCKE